MKTKIISLAFMLIALISFNKAYADNPQINFSKGAPKVSVDDNHDGTFNVCIEYAKISGLGNAKSVDAYLKVEATGDVTCFNDAQLRRGEDANETPGQKLSVTGDKVSLTPRNGSIVITGNVCAKIKGGCKNANFTSFIKNLDITSVILNIAGTDINLSSYVEAGY